MFQFFPSGFAIFNPIIFMKYFLICLLFLNAKSSDRFKNFRALLANSIERNMAPPPDMDAGDSCYHYTALLKVQIDNHSKVVSIEFSDSAPQWIKDDIGRQIEKKRINLPALDSIAGADKIKNCNILFPFIVESEHFPCGTATRERRLPRHYFHFNGNRISAQTYIGEEILVIWPVRHYKKGSE